MARARKWQQPLAGQATRLHAWASHLLADHGIISTFRPNLHAAAPGLWRSAQPGPAQLARWTRRLGLKAVINLRNPGEFGSWPLEVEMCGRLGLRFVNFRMRSRGLPTREELRDMIALINGLEDPVLIHCKSGADRAGLFAAIYLILRDGASAARAANQLSWTYGHLRRAKAGVLDALIETYAREGEAQGVSFADWAGTRYDPDAIAAAFRPGRWGQLIGDFVMRRE